MRPAAARPLRMGVGDSEPADIGRARPQLDDHVRAGGAPSQREEGRKKGLEKKGPKKRTRALEGLSFF